MSILTHAGIAAGVGIGRSDDCATFDYTGWAKKKVIPLLTILHCTRGITFLAHPVECDVRWGRREGGIGLVKRDW